MKHFQFSSNIKQKQSIRRFAKMSQHSIVRLDKLFGELLLQNGQKIASGVNLAAF